MSIEVSKLSKSYGNYKALNNISFSVSRGEIVGLLGVNGAGKSSLLKILSTYKKATSGKAVINGFDVDNQRKKVQNSIGYLPEHNPLYLEMYVKEYLYFVGKVYKISQHRINQVLEQVGLDVHAFIKISQLSKGYRQRVGLAAALLPNPEVLLLDEPTTGLDPNQLQEIRNLIKNLGKHKTVLLSTHIMQEVEAVCDRVLILDKGKIVADKSLKEFLKEQNNQLIEVEFDFKIEPRQMQQMQHLVRVENIHDNQWLLDFDTKDDMRSLVFDFAQEMGLKILSMQVKNQNLETLFREITKREAIAD